MPSAGRRFAQCLSGAKISRVAPAIATDHGSVFLRHFIVAATISTRVVINVPSGNENPRIFFVWFATISSAPTVTYAIITVREMYAIMNVILKTLASIRKMPTNIMIAGSAAIRPTSLSKPAAAKELSSITADALLGPSVTYIERQNKRAATAEIIPPKIP